MTYQRKKVTCLEHLEAVLWDQTQESRDAIEQVNTFGRLIWKRRVTHGVPCSFTP